MCGDVENRFAKLLKSTRRSEVRRARSVLGGGGGGGHGQGKFAGG